MGYLSIVKIQTITITDLKLKTKIHHSCKRVTLNSNRIDKNVGISILFEIVMCRFLKLDVKRERLILPI